MFSYTVDMLAITVVSALARASVFPFFFRGRPEMQVGGVEISHAQLSGGDVDADRIALVEAAVSLARHVERPAARSRHVDINPAHLIRRTLDVASAPGAPCLMTVLLLDPLHRHFDAAPAVARSGHVDAEDDASQHRPYR